MSEKLKPCYKCDRYYYGECMLHGSFRAKKNTCQSWKAKLIIAKQERKNDDNNNT